MQIETIPLDYKPSLPMAFNRPFPVVRADGSDQRVRKYLGECQRVFKNALRTCIQTVGRRATARADGAEARYDDNLTLIAQRDVEQVLDQVIRDDFGPRYSERYLPISGGGIQPWMETFIQKRVTPKGLLDYVTSADMPWLDVEMEEVARRLYTLGGKIGWSWFDLQRAMNANVPLESEKAMAARERAEETRDMILLSGDSGLPKGGGPIPTGLINDATVPTTGVITGNWVAGAATADQVIADVTDWFSTHRTNTRRRYPADTMLLPESELGYIETLRLGGTGKSVRTYLLESIDELERIDVLDDLAGAGAGGTNRAIIYPMDERVIRGLVPLPFMFLPAQEHDLMIVVHGVERIVGVEIRRPFGMLYADGC